MIYKVICILLLLLFLGVLFRENIYDYGRAWYFGVPLPKYSLSVERNVPIAMADGVVLSGDVYRPKNGGKFPTILTRTPYGKENPEHYYAQIAKFFAGQGFVFIVQDVRGKMPSQGFFYPHLTEAQDGSETLAWIVQQPWSDGQTALFGFSYLGVAAWQAVDASKQPIATLVPWFSASNPYRLWYDNGVTYLKQVIFWMSTYGGATTRNILQKDIDAALKKTADWRDLDLLVIGHEMPAYRDFLMHSQIDPFWMQFSTPLPELTKDIPVLLGGGWYDQFLKATIADFKVLSRASEGSKQKASRLIIGPWTHNPTIPIKELNLSADANFLRQFPILLQWYKKWTGSAPYFELAPVNYYLMGANQWHSAQDWPPPEAQFVTYYLNSSEKNGLKEKNPGAGKRHLEFVREDFVPSFGGRMLYSDGKEGPKDQRFLKERRDVLLWSTPPLKQDLPLVGAPKLILYLVSTPLNFDVSVKLMDVFPDGKMQLVTEGYTRIQREKSAEPFSVEINLTDTAYVIPAKHQLQIAVTHSDFPAHEPNTKGTDTSPVHIDVLMGEEYPSALHILKLPLQKTVKNAFPNV